MRCREGNVSACLFKEVLLGLQVTETCMLPGFPKNVDE